MKKSRGQSLMEVAMIGLLAFTFVALGALFFGDDLANLFAGNNPESRFNSSRTVKYENPEDLIGSVEIQFDGHQFKPPIEMVLEAEGYVQTSGSAGQVAQMVRVVEEYINQLENIITLNAGDAGLRTNLINAVTAYKKLLRKIDPEDPPGFMDIVENTGSDDLDIKLALVEMCASASVKSKLEAIFAAAAAYGGSIDGNRLVIFNQYINDLTNILTNVEYSMSGTLYIKYLGIDHIPGNTEQDLNLITEIKNAIGGMTAEEKADVASSIQLYYGGGYSMVSPSMYNGHKMCDTFAASPYNSVEDPGVSPCVIYLYAP